MLPEIASLLTLLLGVHASPVTSGKTCPTNKNWPGWKHIKYAFTFGDSYSQTGFNYTLTPPSPSNPLGNPVYPGYTSSNGPNYIDYLTVKYNASELLTYNLAYGGATVDSNLVAPYLPTVLSLVDQVYDEFIPAYTGRHPAAPSAPAWHGDDTLFTFWIGINDVGNSYFNGTAATTALNARIFAEYAGLVDAVYRLGARNFVFLNVPPVDRSPLTAAEGAAAAALERADLAAFNGLIADLAHKLTAAHRGDVNVWVYDANAVFTRVLDHPASYPQTALYKNTTDYCVDYENGTADEDTFVAECGIPVNEYFWLNSLHPTYPMHDVVAQTIVDELAKGPNVC
ncbi:hypothetical protein BX600DRAFT_539643 [Xylariales sp. PMI_506]|nr:hypothetical protein BX600DRAFT_539643 [Xylariales sp. PMI_506]